MSSLRVIGWVVVLALGVGACGAAVPVADAGDASDVARADGGGMDAPAPPPNRCDTLPRPDVVARDAADAALPNLQARIENIQIQSRTFGAGSCEVQEGCTVPGRRRLLRFDLLTPNAGAGDLYVGPPTAEGRTGDAFEWGICHRHWHFRGYADYRLYGAAGDEVGRGHKQSFCLVDTQRVDDAAPDLCPTERFNCDNQGIHPGWADVYDRTLDCQYVDITDVPPGTYRLRATVNAQRLIPESNYDDNEAALAVVIPPEAADADAGMPIPDPTEACADDAAGPERNCGFVVERSFECTPGQTVTVGCAAACDPALGGCAGDPLIRVCPREAPCLHANAAAESDDACGSACPQVSFPCIWTHYTVLTGGHRAGDAYECRIEVREGP